MLKIMIECSLTGRAVHTGIETDRKTFRALPAFEARTDCPHCKGIHRWNKDDACLAPSGGPVRSVH